MNTIKLLSSTPRRDLRAISISKGYRYSALSLDPTTAASLPTILPTLVSIAITESGLILIGPAEIIAFCRDPTLMA